MRYLDKLANIRKIETIELNGLQYYNGVHVCRVLGFTNNRTAIKRHTLERETTVVQTQGKRDTTFVDESGFLALLFASKAISEEIKGGVRDELLEAFAKCTVSVQV